MPHKNPASTYLTLRMPRDLRDALKRQAAREANSESAVARRLLAQALTRRAPLSPPDPRPDEGAA